MIRLFDSPIEFASTTSPSPARKSAPIRHRFFEGAAVSHLTEDFDGGSASLDGELRMSLRTLRKRARNLERNNGSMGRFLEICRANLIGQGIRLQSSAKSRSGEQDTDLNRKIEAGWKEWGRKENASASGRQTFSDLENFLVTSLKRDGEAIFQKVYRGKWGFQLRPIDPAYLDETFSERLPNGNRIIMSVEIDDFERPVAYWLRTPYENLFSRQESRPVERVRIPAEQILHIFYSTDAAQVRGVPPIAPVLFELRQLGGYKQAEVVAARVAASKMGFYKKPPVENDAYSGDGDDDENKVTAPTEEMEPGSFYELPDGWDFQSFNPEHPTTAFGQFVSSGFEVVQFYRF
jgi:lambda family phage portal protein